MKPLTYEEVKQLVKAETSQAQIFAETIEVGVAKKQEQVLTKTEIAEMSKQIESALVIQQKSETQQISSQTIQIQKQKADVTSPVVAKIIPSTEASTEFEVSELRSAEEVEEKPVLQEVEEDILEAQKKFAKETKAAVQLELIEEPAVRTVPEKIEQKVTTENIKQVAEKPEKMLPTLSKAVTLEEFTAQTSTMVLKEEVEEMTVTQEIAIIKETHEKKDEKVTKVSEIEAVFEQPNVINVAEKLEQKPSTAEIRPLKEEAEHISPIITKSLTLQEVIEEPQLRNVEEETLIQTEEREVSPIEGIYTPHEPSETTAWSMEETLEQPKLADIKFPTTESVSLTSVPFESLKAECEDVPHVLEALADKIVSEAISETVEESKFPKFETGLRNVSVVENNVLHLEVFVSDTTLPIKWYMENVELGPSPGVIIKQDSGHSEYIIEECYPEDEGLYTAVATNEFGKVTTSAYITVLRKY